MISRLKLMDFRCYGSFSWQIPQQGAIILGNNARGKTSLLEAVCFLLRLQSPRTARTGPLVSHGKQSFGIRGELPGQIRRILWAPDAPDLRVNGEPRKDQRSYLADLMFLYSYRKTRKWITKRKDHVKLRVKKTGHGPEWEKVEKCSGPRPLLKCRLRSRSRFPSAARPDLPALRGANNSQ